MTDFFEAAEGTLTGPEPGSLLPESDGMSTTPVDQMSPEESEVDTEDASAL